MRYVVLLVGYADRHWDELTEAEQAAWMQRHDDFDAAVAAREGAQVVTGAELTDGDSATVFRGATERGPRTLVDGPFAEATEGIGGFYMIDAPDLDVLVELLDVLPPYVMEIRPTTGR